MKTNQTLANECVTLACFCKYTFDGENAIPGWAFGLSLTEGMTGDLLDLSEQYYFEIRRSNAGLLLIVDMYSPIAPQDSGWDVDAWEDQKVFIEVCSCTRRAFSVLSQIGRSLLGGRNVTLFDGTVINGVRLAA
jgi:hypothetical protein